jgi:hypothetical protein
VLCIYVYRTGREYVPRVIENELLLLTDESNTQHVSRTGRDLVPRVIENDLPHEVLIHVPS